MPTVNRTRSQADAAAQHLVLVDLYRRAYGVPWVAHRRSATRPSLELREWFSSHNEQTPWLEVSARRRPRAHGQDPFELFTRDESVTERTNGTAAVNGLIDVHATPITFAPTV
jgi:hypothetical protein